MSRNDHRSVVQAQGEISDEQLDSVSGGQQVVKLEKITVTAKREPPTQVVKLDKVVVTAKREPPLDGTQIASTNGKSKTN
ncbi:MAG: hypothetical protein IPP91_06230 [Betaproteobacteria bacterium]|nr:hypothetical protein [Betaproteobacteria bacterium]